MKHRQLARVRQGILEGEKIAPHHRALFHNAMDQLEEALILHYRPALHTLKFGLKCLVTLRCPLCGRRHWTHPYYKKIGGGWLACGYGFSFILTFLFRDTITKLFHGED